MLIQFTDLNMEVWHECISKTNLIGPQKPNAPLGAISLIYSDLSRKCLALGPFELREKNQIKTHLIKAMNQFFKKLYSEKFISISHTFGICKNSLKEEDLIQTFIFIS